jgi:hypothetical protein
MLSKGCSNGWYTVGHVVRKKISDWPHTELGMCCAMFPGVVFIICGTCTDVEER